MPGLRVKNNAMDLTLKTFADFRELLDKQLMVSVPAGSTVRGLLGNLADRYPAFLAQVLDNRGELRSQVNVLLNGRNIQFLCGLESALNDGDVVAIFPPVAGG